MFNGLSGDNEDSFKTMRSKTSSGQDEIKCEKKWKKKMEKKLIQSQMDVSGISHQVETRDNV